MANENNKLVLVSVDKHLQKDTVSSQHGFWQLKPILAAFRNLTCLTLIAPDCALPDLLIQKTTAPNSPCVIFPSREISGTKCVIFNG